MLSVEVSGAKNISLALLPTALFADRIIFKNLPNIVDVNIQREILRTLGINEIVEKNTIIYIKKSIDTFMVPERLGSKIRASFYFLGALLSCTGRAEIPHPGGCNAEERKIDIHVGALRYMGARVIVNNKTIYAENRNMLAKHIRLPMPSKGATINLIFASLRLCGQTVIENASIVPEIRTLVNLLQGIGNDIFIDGSNIIIRGRHHKISSITYTVQYDRIEMATFVILGLLLGEEICINGINLETIKDFLGFLDSINVVYSIRGEKIIIYRKQKLKPAQVYLGFPPAIDSDYGPIITPLLCLINGRSIVEDRHNTHRINNLLAELAFLGAKYRMLAENVFEIQGIREFCGNRTLVGQDIRGSMGMVLAALVSKGRVKVKGLSHIDRAYENFLGKLELMGINVDVF